MAKRWPVGRSSRGEHAREERGWERGERREGKKSICEYEQKVI